MDKMRYIYQIGVGDQNIYVADDEDDKWAGYMKDGKIKSFLLVEPRARNVFDTTIKWKPKGGIIINTKLVVYAKRVCECDKFFIFDEDKKIYKKVDVEKL